MSYRRLGVLIDHLPPESATKTAVRDGMGEEQLAALSRLDTGDAYGSWSRHDLLLADVVDGLRVLAYLYMSANGAKTSPPTPYPRPGVTRPRRRDTPEGREYLERLRSAHRHRLA